jgi:hypothetical protein
MIKSILTVATIVSVGAAALAASVSSADARGFKRGGFHGKGFRHVVVHRPHVRHVHFKYYKPYVYGAVATAAIAAPAYAVAAPKAAANPCLTKEYTKDKLVVFIDRCTKEVAAVPVGGAQQQGGAPQQQQQPEPGEAEPAPTK